MLVLFPDIFKPLLTIPVAPVNTVMINDSWSKSAEIIYLDFYILISFQPHLGYIIIITIIIIIIIIITLVLSLNKELN
jgi:hypothetical protein